LARQAHASAVVGKQPKLDHPPQGLADQAVELDAGSRKKCIAVDPFQPPQRKYQ
jgi:hypothetical protein